MNNNLLKYMAFLSLELDRFHHYFHGISLCVHLKFFFWKKLNEKMMILHVLQWLMERPALTNFVVHHFLAWICFNFFISSGRDHIMSSWSASMWVKCLKTCWVGWIIVLNGYFYQVIADSLGWLIYMIAFYLILFFLFLQELHFTVERWKNQITLPF